MKPILFNTDMVRAILDGRKTVTRRVVKPQPLSNTHPNLFVTPPYRSGDILYAPEAWKCRFAMLDQDSLGYEVVFRDGKIVRFRFDDKKRAKKWAKYARKDDNNWQSPYFMPKEAARIFLRVTDVRVERLQDITADGITKEGIQSKKSEWAKTDFADTWNSTIKPADLDKYGWAANPWAWVIEFERISKNEAMK